jgi:4-hydroxybenzoate polyprenyltransferase
MDTPLLVISVLGIMLVLLLRIGDLVGAVAFGVVVLVIGWAYQSTRRKRLREKQENRH